MKTTTLQERVLIMEYAQQGLTDRRIACLLKISIHTVRKWRRRGRSQGREGLWLHLGRPAKGALSTFSPTITETVRAWRIAHPGWGPKTLQVELMRDESIQTQRLPSQATLTRWLKQERFSRPYEKHTDLPETKVSMVHTCHEEWELDSRGHKRVPNAGVIALINVNDVFSKVKLTSYPCWLGKQRAFRHASTEDYQLVLRLAFTEWGLPERLAVDHDTVFYDNRSKSPFPTRFHLWLLALGVSVTFGRMNQPTDQAMTERSHQLWYHQVLEGQTFADQGAVWRALETRRTFLNYHLPCATLGEVPPLVAHPEALCTPRPYRPEWEADLIDLQRVDAYLSQGRWFRKGSHASTVSLGSTVYYLGADWKRAEVEITFAPEDRHLVFNSFGMPEKRLPVRGIDVQSLMGELGSFIHHVNGFQLALPFSWVEWRQTQLCQLLG